MARVREIETHEREWRERLTSEICERERQRLLKRDWWERDWWERDWQERDWRERGNGREIGEREGLTRECVREISRRDREIDKRDWRE